jgi:hypothetical protein
VKKNKAGNKVKVEAAVESVRGNVSNEATIALEVQVSPPPEIPTSVTPATAHRPEIGLPANRLRWLLPDVLKGAGALLVIIVAVAILLNPPLIQSDFPKVSYLYNGNTYTNAILFRPLAMPNRYYIAFPEKIADRYQYFAVDRRREVATLMTNTLSRTIFGMPVIKRTDPMGLDLEFRHLDNSEWRVSFLAETILFSNAVLSVRLDVK